MDSGKDQLRGLPSWGTSWGDLRRVLAWIEKSGAAGRDWTPADLSRWARRAVYVDRQSWRRTDAATGRRYHSMRPVEHRRDPAGAVTWLARWFAPGLPPETVGEVAADVTRASRRWRRGYLSPVFVGAQRRRGAKGGAAALRVGGQRLGGVRTGQLRRAASEARDRGILTSLARGDSERTAAAGAGVSRGCVRRVRSRPRAVRRNLVLGRTEAAGPGPACLLCQDRGFVVDAARNTARRCACRSSRRPAPAPVPGEVRRPRLSGRPSSRRRNDGGVEASGGSSGRPGGHEEALRWMAAAALGRDPPDPEGDW